jgi:hypothetical protein
MDILYITVQKVAIYDDWIESNHVYFKNFDSAFYCTSLHKSPNPTRFVTIESNKAGYLRTLIVKADIHRGLYSPARTLLHAPPVFDLPALVRRHPLYILLRVRRELCFW